MENGPSGLLRIKLNIEGFASPRFDRYGLKLLFNCVWQGNGTTHNPPPQCNLIQYIIEESFSFCKVFQLRQLAFFLPLGAGFLAGATRLPRGGAFFLASMSSRARASSTVKTSSVFFKDTKVFPIFT